MVETTTRRTMLKSGVAAAIAALLSSPRQSSGHQVKEYPDSMGVLVDLGRCVGCAAAGRPATPSRGCPNRKSRSTT